MFKITEEELDKLIAEHNGQKTDRIPLYKLCDLVKYGMMYVYGTVHYKTGKVVPCKAPFSLFEPHSCEEMPLKTEEVVTKPPVETPVPLRTFEFKSKSSLKATPSCTIHCWAGYNLAMITNKGELHAYFKRDLLFKKRFSLPTAIAASANEIYVGTKKGEVIKLNPITQLCTTEHVHSGEVTSLNLVDSIPLSASTDGTIFYKKLLKISDSGVMMAKSLDISRIACVTNDNRVVIANETSKGTKLKSFTGHTHPIADMNCQNGLCVSSSYGGYFGFIRDGTEMSMRHLGASKHRFVNDTTLLGYGLDSISLFDMARETTTVLADSFSSSADVRENLVAYTVGDTVHLRDIRSNESLQVVINKPLSNVSFSNSGYLLLVVPRTSAPLMLNLRSI